MTVDLVGSLGCGKYKYICARVRKDKPNPDYKLLGKSRDAITGCAPATCISKKYSSISHHLYLFIAHFLCVFFFSSGFSYVIPCHVMLYVNSLKCDG